MKKKEREKKINICVCCGEGVVEKKGNFLVENAV